MRTFNHLTGSVNSQKLDAVAPGVGAAETRSHPIDRFLVPREAGDRARRKNGSSYS